MERARRCATRWFRYPTARSAKSATTTAPRTARPAITPPLKLEPWTAAVDEPAKADASVLIVFGKMHSPHLHPLSASPEAPKRVMRTLCLKAHSVPVAASHVMSSVSESESIVCVRSMGAPEAPQKVVPGMHVQRRFWQVQSTVPFEPNDDEVDCTAVRFPWTHESAAQKNCSTMVVFPVKGAYQSCAVMVPFAPYGAERDSLGSTVFWIVKMVEPVKTP